MTTLEHKLKKAMLVRTVDIIVKSADKSPERCSRNLIELGRKAYPNKLTKVQLKELNIKLIALCKSHDISKLKEAFMLIFASSD